MTKLPGAFQSRSPPVGLGARVLRAIRELLELAAFLQLDDDFLRFVFLLDEDVAHLVFLVAHLRLDRVVFLAQRGLGDRIGLDPVGDIGAHQHRLRGEVGLVLDVGGLVDALLLRLAHEQLAGVELLADRIAQLGRIRLALRQALLQQVVEVDLGIELLACGGGRGGRRCGRRGLALGRRGLVLRLGRECRKDGEAPPLRQDVIEVRFIVAFLQVWEGNSSGASALIESAWIGCGTRSATSRRTRWCRSRRDKPENAFDTIVREKCPPPPAAPA